MSVFSSNAMTVMRDIAEASATPEQCKSNILDRLEGHETEVFHSQVLVAQYIPPSRTKGGIILTDNRVKEERHQGTIFLVIGMGPAAFKDDNIAQFHGKELYVGDWVMAVAGDGIAMDIRGMPCRLYQDTRILMRVTDPSIYY